MRGDAALLLESSISNSLVNADSSRRSRPSLDVRKEGWTERWGSQGNGPAGESAARLATPRSKRWSEWMPPSDWDRIEVPYAHRTAESKSMPLMRSSSMSPSSSQGSGEQQEGAGGDVRLTLTQHRPAWLEQLALRVAGVPHAVINSPNSTSEATGPLPFLLDLGGGSGDGAKGTAAGASSSSGEGDDDAAAAPGLVGRRNPGGMAAVPPPIRDGGKSSPEEDGKKGGAESSPSSGGAGAPSTCRSDIVEYLRLRRAVDLDAGLSSAQRSESLAYSVLIRGDLDVSLAALRYGDDDAWEQVYRPQCVEACLCPDDDAADRRLTKRRWGIFHWVASFQARTERVSALRGLLLSNGRARDELFDGRDVLVEPAVRRARRGYDALEAKLSSVGGKEGGDEGGEEKTPRKYLLGTDCPTSVDAALFAHLAEALCDVHLVTVLAEYPNLIRLFQGTHEAYFGGEYSGCSGSRPEWVRWNDAANARNAFNRLPLGEAGGGGGAASGGDFKEAMAIMQSMALRRRDLGEALLDAAALRGKTDGVGARGRRSAGELFHRWRMGGSMQADFDEDNSKEGGKQGDRKKSTSDESPGGDGASGGERGEDDTTRKNREQMERMVRESRTNDELWVSGVVVASAVAFAIAAAKATATGQ